MNDTTLHDDIKTAQIEFLANNLPEDSIVQLEAKHQLSVMSDQKNDFDMVDLDISEINLLGRQSIGYEDIAEDL